MYSYNESYIFKETYWDAYSNQDEWNKYEEKNLLKKLDVVMEK